MRRTPALVLAALLLPAGLAACSDDDPSEIATGDGFSVEAALAELPDPDEDDLRLTVVVADMAEAAEANEAGERPTSGDDEDLGRWFLTATGSGAPEDGEVLPPVFVPSAEVLGTQRLLSAGEIEEELGWSVLDVDAVAEVLAPPFRFAVVTGDVGEDTLTDAGLEPDEDGVVSVGNGEDGETDPDAASAARPIGAPVRMAADGDRLAASSSTDAVADWVDGDPETLADRDDLRAVAAALDDADALSAYITTALDDEGGHTAVGIGWSVEDGESRITIAYAYGSEADAEDGADAVEAAFAGASQQTGRPLADLLALDEVEVDGDVVVAHTRPGPEGRPQVAMALLQQGSAPFVLGGG